MDIDRTLRELAADPFAPVDLAELNLHLAADHYPNLDVPVYLAQLDELAEEARHRLRGDLEQRTAAFAEFLFDECGFSGNTDEYYDPRNSFLNEVLDRRLGLPIALSILAIGVGERCGLRVVGVGLPGHFVAKAVSGCENEVLFDPFHGGRILDEVGVEELIESVTGQPFHAHEDSLAATPPGLVAQRMLNNLKATLLKAGDFSRAARVIRRLMQLMPADPTQRRDLGVSLIRAGQCGPAIQHLTAYLEMAPTAEDAAAARQFLREARKQVAMWN
ncbi:MAG: transglutaminase-like domain-containing protein [Fimbriiglobus sp.]|nr:transglutaminase-like domain-containing protein [Fimbriiglobus sp.]